MSEWECCCKVLCESQRVGDIWVVGGMYGF